MYDLSFLNQNKLCSNWKKNNSNFLLIKKITKATLFSVSVFFSNDVCAKNNLIDVGDLHEVLLNPRISFEKKNIEYVFSEYKLNFKYAHKVCSSNSDFFASLSGFGPKFNYKLVSFSYYGCMLEFSKLLNKKNILKVHEDCVRFECWSYNHFNEKKESNFFDDEIMFREYDEKSVTCSYFPAFPKWICPMLIGSK